MILSPSPSPPSAVDDFSQLDLDNMLSVQHPQHAMHPSLLYHPHPQALDFTGTSTSTSTLALPQSDSPPPNAQAGKRYRSAPAKTFQCAGYGDCRMVFSRSEHLARHIRKHTGERPFACHCTKQFSRLDNLRQHAQTVHSAPEDKPLNERMMRALAGVNASMMAGVRGRRRYGDASSSPSPSTPSFSFSPSSSLSASPPLPSPPYSVPSHHHSPSFPPGSFAAASMNDVSPPFASPPLSEYSYTGSPLPSPSFGSFPTSSSPSAYPYHHGQDYVGVRVKQEEIELDSGSDRELEGFYAAVEHGPSHGLSSYPSNRSLSSSSSSSSSADERPDTARQGYRPPPLRPAYVRSQSSGGASTSTSSSRSAASSPAASPSVGSFSWGQGGQQPSPPSSPPFYQHGHHPHGGHGHGHHGAHAPPPAHPQGEQLYGWLEDGSVGEMEMSNAQYYAAIQAQHPHSPPVHPHHHAGQGGEYFSSYPHGHGQGQGGYAVYA